MCRDGEANEGGRDGRAPRGPRGWHGRGYLPHFDAGEAPQSVTFRLAGSLPAAVLQDWRDELQINLARTPGHHPTSRTVAADTVAARAEERRRIEEYLNL